MNNENFMELKKGEKREQVIPDYRKKSFYEGCSDTFEDVFNRMAECGFSQELISIIGSMDFSKTEAIVYKGVYITPCMIEGMLDTLYNIKKKEVSNNILDTLKRGYSLYECEELVNLNLI